MEGDWASAIARDSALVWPLSSVRQLHRRRYLMAHTAVELFQDGGDLILLNFKNKRVRSVVRMWLKKKCRLEYASSWLAYDLGEVGS